MVDFDEQFNLSAACFAHRLLDHGRAVRGADGQIASWRPHVPGRDWAVERGHVVALFREPTQRLLSAWHQAAGPHGVPRPEAARLRSPTEYARYCSKAGVCVEHKLTQYLIGRQPHSWADVQEAAAHIERRDVLFVGLTELWNLSVCAFHRQLGGTPQPAEFAPSRQYNGSAKGSSRYFASELPVLRRVRRVRLRVGALEVRARRRPHGLALRDGALGGRRPPRVRGMSP